MYVCMYVCSMYVCNYVCEWMYVCYNILLYKYIYVCMYVYVYTFSTLRNQDVNGWSGQVNEVQLLTCTATTGTFTLFYNGKPSKAIPYNANAVTVTQALLSIPAITGVKVSTHTYTFSSAHIMNVFMYVCMYVTIFIHLHHGRDLQYMHKRMYVYDFKTLSVCMYYVCKYVCMYVCMYVTFHV